MSARLSTGFGKNGPFSQDFQPFPLITPGNPRILMAATERRDENGKRASQAPGLQRRMVGGLGGVQSSGDFMERVHPLDHGRYRGAVLFPPVPAEPAPPPGGGPAEMSPGDLCRHRRGVSGGLRGQPAPQVAGLGLFRPVRKPAGAGLPPVHRTVVPPVHPGLRSGRAGAEAPGADVTYFQKTENARRICVFRAFFVGITRPRLPGAIPRGGSPPGPL